MAFTRDELYRHVSHFLGESNALTPDNTQHATVKKIAGIEISAAEYLLALHPWNYASALNRLALDATHDDADPDSDPIGWKYAYKKGPILRVNYLTPTGKYIDRLTQAGQWDDKGGRILANCNPLYCEGVQAEFAQQSKLGYWPRPAGIAYASILGDWLTGPVRNSRGHQNDMSARSLDLVETAKVWDAQQAPPPPKRMGRWNRGRFRGAARFDSGEL